MALSLSFIKGFSKLARSFKFSFEQTKTEFIALISQGSKKSPINSFLNKENS